MSNNQLSENQRNNLTKWLFLQVIIPVSLILIVFCIAYVHHNNGDLYYQFFGTGDFASTISLLILNSIVENMKINKDDNSILYYIMFLLMSFGFYVTVKIESLKSNAIQGEKNIYTIVNIAYFLICICLLFYSQYKIEKQRNINHLNNQIISEETL